MFNPEKPPELQVTRWFNANAPVTLAGLKGRVVVLTAFQMLCPGCVSHALPQAKKLVERFSSNEVAVIGLHSVFEHHDAMTPAALAAFIHEYRWPFAIGIDKPDGADLPKTMAAYEMRGTPTLLLFDRQGRLRRHYLGQVDDIRLSAEIMSLAIEAADATRDASINIERRLAAALIDPEAAHNHSHDQTGHEHGDDCGCGHDHGAHAHGHDHGPSRADANRPASSTKPTGKAKAKQ
jgi:peroxiredoxin